MKGQSVCNIKVLPIGTEQSRTIKVSLKAPFCMVIDDDYVSKNLFGFHLRKGIKNYSITKVILREGQAQVLLDFIAYYVCYQKYYYDVSILLKT